MNLRLFILVCLSATSFHLSAQFEYRFADSTAQWNVLDVRPNTACSCNLYKTQSYHVVADGDTLFVTEAYQKILSGTGSAFFLHRDNQGRIFKTSALDSPILTSMIYDFSKNTGDTFSLTNTSGLAALNILCKVESVDTVMLDRPRRRMIITYNNDQSDPDIWIDGIGSTRSHFLFPGFEHTAGANDAYTLLCFMEGNSTVYHDTVYNQCLIDSSVATGFSRITTVQSKVFPNPVGSGMLEVELVGDEEGLFRLFDIAGRMVLQKKLIEKMNRVEMHEIGGGIYFYNIALPGQKSLTGKLIVE